MPLPRCPACGSLIFPSARDGGDTSPLCEGCQERARQTGHAGPSLRFAATEVREELVEPSGPFLLPKGVMPPEEVLEHLETRAPIVEPAPPPSPDEVVVEPSGPFVVPGAPPPPVALEETPAPKEPIATREPERERAEEIVEPSGPFLAPSGSQAIAPPPPVSFEPVVTPEVAEPAPVVGVAHGTPHRVPVTDPAAPSVVVEPGLAGRRMEATLELPRDLRDALTPTPRVQTAWTALALAFAAGMLAGAALAVAVLKL